MMRFIFSLIVITSCANLSGCYSAVEIKNADSDKYRAVGLFDEPYWNKLKADDVLHLFQRGWFDKKTKVLVVVLELDSKKPSVNEIKKYQILDSDNKIIGESLGSIIKMTREEGSKGWYNGTVRIAFNTIKQHYANDIKRLRIFVVENEKIIMIEFDLYADTFYYFPT